MTRHLAVALVGSFATVAVLGVPSRGAAQAPKPQRTGYVEANGVNYYYEIYGQGRPLLLLHGGLMSISSFAPVILPPLAKERQVIAVDLQGHGRTTLGERPINLNAIG